MQEQRPTLWKIFCENITISACTFGGGFVMAGLMKKAFVDRLHWIDEAEMMDYVAMAQSCPGPIAVNAAILVGWKLRGLPGMLISVLAMILPPMVILSIISVFYNAFSSSRPVALLLRGLQAGVAAVILDVVLSLGKKVTDEKSWISLVLMAAVFAVVRFLKLNVILVVAAVLVFGILRAVLQAVKGGRNS